MILDIVVVTYNRLEKLKHALRCYELQTASFRNLIVVNNCSTDLTEEFLDDWKSKPSNFTKVVINAKENLGGSGGFYIGQKYALEHSADWVFLADDDAYADENMVNRFLDYCNQHKVETYSVIAAEVLAMNGDICFNHRCRYIIYRHHYFRTESTKIEDYQKGEFKFDVVSYVGPFINCRALKAVGLVRADYFIYFDDSEHSIRLAKYGDLVCVPAIKITHDGGAKNEQANKKIIASWRDYYLTRNKENMLLRHFPIVGIYQYFHFIFFDYLKNPFSIYNRLRLKAFNDAILNRLGKNRKYYPGWVMFGKK